MLNEGALHLVQEQPCSLFDLSPEDKDRYNADIQATNILLQGLPKYIYSLIDHYTDAKDIWDNVKMLLEGLELTKEDRESQLYDDFEHFRQHKGETIHDYYVRFAKLINDMRNIKMTMSRMQLNSKFVNNMLPEWGTTGYGGAQNRVGNANPGQARQVKCYNCNGIGHIARNCTQPKRPQNSEYFKDKMLLMQAQENGVALDEEQLLFLAGGHDNAVDEDVDEQPVQDLALNVDNVFQADDCDAFDSDVDEAPTAQTMFMANLSSADPVYDEAGPSYDSDILSEVHDHDQYQDVVCEHHEEHEMHDDVQPNYVVDSHADYTSDSNMIPYDQYVKDNAVPVVQSNVSSVPNDAYMMIYNDMYEPHAQSVSKTTRNTVVDNSLTAELATYKEQVELYERRARFELMEREQKIDEQLRIVITDRNIKEENLKKELHSKENKYLKEFLDMKALKEKVEDKLYKQEQSLQTVHMLCKPKPIIDKLIRHSKAFKQRIKEMKDIFEELEAENVFMIATNSDLKVQIQNKLSCVNKDHVKPKVLAPGKYAIDVEPIPPRNRNNREVHLVYLKHLKESIETLCEIIEEAKVERPLDSSLASACRYTKHSQELLEYVIGTCPKALNTRDNKHASTSLPKKKQVTFEEQCAMSKSNTHKPVEQLNCQKTNVPVPPSTGVNSCTGPLADHSLGEIPRKIGSLGISSKHTVINLNSHYVCQTYNKCLISANHDMCVVTYLHSVNASPSVKNVVRKVKQVWKPKQVRQVWKATGKVLTSVGYQWRPTGRIFTLGEQFPSTRLTKPKVVSAKQTENQAITFANQREPNQNWGSNFPNSPSLSVFKCSSTPTEPSGHDESSSLYEKLGLTNNLTDYYERVGIFHQKTVLRTPQQNGVVERRNRTLVEAARTMLIFSKAPMFLWAEAMATACLGALCYPTNDNEDLGKLQPTADIRIFVGYAPSRKGYRIYNKRTRRIMETIHVQFDELTEQMAPMQLSTRLAPTFLTPGHISSGLVPNPVPAAPYVPPTNKDLEILFQLMFDEYLEPPRVERPVHPAPAAQVPVNSTGTPSSTTIDQDAPSPSHSPLSSTLQSPSLHQGVLAEYPLMEDNPFAPDRPND
ncbi:retrovirus-related pol polyprotein from transposon TNT 1-94 [Tanacetum coccineum]